MFSNISSKADENNIKYYSKDEGVLSIMYHRFNESEYPSTNIQMDIANEKIFLMIITKDDIYNITKENTKIW